MSMDIGQSFANKSSLKNADFYVVKKLFDNCSLLPKVLVGGIWSAKTSKFSGGCALGPRRSLRTTDRSNY